MSDYKVRELAKQLNVSLSKAYAMIQTGAVPSYTLPGSKSIRVREEDVKKIRGDNSPN